MNGIIEAILLGAIIGYTIIITLNLIDIKHEIRKIRKEIEKNDK